VGDVDKVARGNPHLVGFGAWKSFWLGGGVLCAARLCVHALFQAFAGLGR